MFSKLPAMTSAVLLASLILVVGCMPASFSGITDSDWTGPELEGSELEVNGIFHWVPDQSNRGRSRLDPKARLKVAPYRAGWPGASLVPHHFSIQPAQQEIGPGAGNFSFTIRYRGFAHKQLPTTHLRVWIEDSNGGILEEWLHALPVNWEVKGSANADLKGWTSNGLFFDLDHEKNYKYGYVDFQLMKKGQEVSGISANYKFPLPEADEGKHAVHWPFPHVAPHDVLVADNVRVSLCSSSGFQLTSSHIPLILPTVQELNLNVMMSVSPYEGLEEFALVKKAMEGAADVLFRSTDGQIRIASVYIYGPDTWDSPDILFHNDLAASGSCGEGALACAFVGQDKVFSGIDILKHIEINSAPGAAKDSMGRLVVHELMHSRFGCFDEYLNAADEKWSSCTQDPILNLETRICVMNAHGGNSEELCRGNLHNEDTAQHQKRGKPCYETVRDALAGSGIKLMVPPLVSVYEVAPFFAPEISSGVTYFSK